VAQPGAAAAPTTTITATIITTTITVIVVTTIATTIAATGGGGRGGVDEGGGGGSDDDDDGWWIPGTSVLGWCKTLVSVLEVLLGTRVCFGRPPKHFQTSGTSPDPPFRSRHSFF